MSEAFVVVGLEPGEHGTEEIVIGVAPTMAAAERLVAAECGGGDVRWSPRPTGPVAEELECWRADTAAGGYTVTRWRLEA